MSILSWLGNKLGSAASWVGNKVSAATNWVGNKVIPTIEKGVDFVSKNPILGKALAPVTAAAKTGLATAKQITGGVGSIGKGLQLAGRGDIAGGFRTGLSGFHQTKRGVSMAKSQIEKKGK